MDDVTRLATTVYVPDGEPPMTGWPGVILVHGLGGSRQEMNLLAETYFAPYGYAVLTYDARGHGQSGGYVTVAGPREVGPGIAVKPPLEPVAVPDLVAHAVELDSAARPMYSASSCCFSRRTPLTLTGDCRSGTRVSSDTAWDSRASCSACGCWPIASAANAAALRQGQWLSTLI